MKKHYISIPLRYRHDEHPFFEDMADPDGLIEVRGGDAWVARKAVHDLIGDAWGFYYTEEEASEENFRRNFPHGVFYVIEITTNGKLVKHFYAGEEAR